MSTVPLAGVRDARVETILGILHRQLPFLSARRVLDFRHGDVASAGARRRTIVVSVMESLRCYLPRFTLQAVIDEVRSWHTTGASCFARQLLKLGLSTPAHSILDDLYPAPSG